MELRESLPSPSGTEPASAWTQSIGGHAYTVKRIGGGRFGIWRDVEELGSFALHRGAADELRADDLKRLSVEARAVVREFIATYSVPFEGAAKRD